MCFSEIGCCFSHSYCPDNPTIIPSTPVQNHADFSIGCGHQMEIYIETLNGCCPVSSCNSNRLIMPKAPLNISSLTCPIGTHYQSSSHGCCPSICPDGTFALQDLGLDKKSSITSITCPTSYILVTGIGCCPSYCSNPYARSMPLNSVAGRCPWGYIYDNVINGCCQIYCPSVKVNPIAPIFLPECSTITTTPPQQNTTTCQLLDFLTKTEKKMTFLCQNPSLIFMDSYNGCCPRYCNLSDSIPILPDPQTQSCPYTYTLDPLGSACCKGTVTCPLGSLPSKPVDNYAQSCSTGSIFNYTLNGCCPVKCPNNNNPISPIYQGTQFCQSGFEFSTFVNGCCPLSCPDGSALIAFDSKYPQSCPPLSLPQFNLGGCCSISVQK